MKPLKSHEPLEHDIADTLVELIGPMQAAVLGLGDIDRRFQGRVSNTCRCVWLKNGYRVEFQALNGAGVLASVSKEPDPEYPGRPGMKTCPMCNGKKVTGQFVPATSRETVKVAGFDVAVAGSIVDQPCGCCEGQGQVTLAKWKERTGQ